MKIIGIRDEKNQYFQGILEKDYVRVLNPEGEVLKELPREKIVWDVPRKPTKIVAVGLNYRRHAEEMNMPIPEEPVIFLKPPSALLPHLGTIVWTPQSKQIDYEAELAIVIGKETKNVSVKEARACILGFTAFNDVTARDLQRKDGQWTRAKSFDTFAPLGPVIDTQWWPESSTAIRLYKNGKICQDDVLGTMIFSVEELVSFISRVMTLYPGDVIATGTPSGIGPMQGGDRVSVEIEGLEPLVNTMGKPLSF
ncbi:fumarylacetoacetate hydrolase family protein [Thermospira aquatica]|uniref:Fumarylacetoacetate hydrolase family protein n=1 Tax=Thermospira aquatica TaxID=2828656 RepID=A0AAX3BC64_9SPIR|nr:fumarylacetoacetate hydrolase family protein [Thermospira aquatica]URA09818.1 fumarylacetoacetate hydrolase family protein [Thermospira aquatica]